MTKKKGSETSEEQKRVLRATPRQTMIEGWKNQTSGRGLNEGHWKTQEPSPKGNQRGPEHRNRNSKEPDKGVLQFPTSMISRMNFEEEKTEKEKNSESSKMQDMKVCSLGKPGLKDLWTK